MIDLRENEHKTLLALKSGGGRMGIETIVKASGLAHASVMRAALTLESKNLVIVQEKKITKVSLTDEGKIYAEKGLPERRLVNALKGLGGEAAIKAVSETTSLDRNLSAIALGWLSRKGWAKIEKKDQKLILLKEPVEGADEKLLSFLNNEGTVTAEALPKDLFDSVSVLKGRNHVEVHDEAFRELELTEVGWELVRKGLKIVKEISQLTPDLVATGKWREVKLRKYDIKASVAKTWPGKKHSYLRFLDDLKEKLISLGFKEMTGPIVELSFFNCDALYMPQDHPAREIHDMYLVGNPDFGNLDQYNQFLKNVKETHEKGGNSGSKGWRYSFSTIEAAHLLLRSHTTSVSVRTMISDELKIPGKYFAIARCYRPDVIDKTHLSEFNQVEGIVLGEDLTLQDLLGVLEKFASDVAGAEKIKYRPDYYPFTEPSVELDAFKKDCGWLEFGGSGIFRPEVTIPLGIKVPVLAWGLGVDRLYMMKAGIDDIRYLFSQDLDWLRRTELV